MVAKKRNQLRNKAASRLSKPEEFDSTEVVSLLPPDPKAFLHQPRESKKEKVLNKSQSFVSKIKDQASLNNSGISKSSLRRRKRKLRDDLKPKMQDLLTSLQKEGVMEEIKDQSEQNEQRQNVTNFTASNNPFHLESKESGSVRIKKNEPNIKNQKGAKALAQNETARFQQVLKNQSFQQSPFSALREVIKMGK